VAAPLDADVLLVGPEGLTGTEGRELVSVGRWKSGGDAAEAGRLSYLAVERAVQLASEGTIDAITTAPISKSALACAGYSWPGHTEMLRDLTGAPFTVLCLAAEETPLGAALRVALVTGHMALRDVPGAYTVTRLQQVARLTHADLRRWWGLARPRLSVCAFNPHASDDGLFGDEESRVCIPAIKELRDEGLDVSGPYPADTVFLQAMRGEADAVLAPYHDVGMTAIKTAAFGGAVNVTLGIPFPRTSPDHGTAFDIAGSGAADPSSMRAALEMAAHLARRSLTSRSDEDRLTDR
jgi:4-hydroxythreonine-4-phosphate dehydrogenase